MVGYANLFLYIYDVKEIKVMKKILYLHGLESSNVCEKVDFLREQAEVLAPLIDYKNPNIVNELMNMVESFQPTLIIGSSMGGYLGLFLADNYKIECLVFNPAIHSCSFEIKVPSSKGSDFTFQPIVILGMEDNVINPLLTKEILDTAYFYCDIEEIEGMGHRVPLNVFINMYNKYEKYFI